jgi:hypothetical protein
MSTQPDKCMGCDEHQSRSSAVVETVDTEGPRRGDGAPEPSSNGYRIPRICTLDGFVEETNRSQGIQITQLEPLSKLCVETQHSLYQITVLIPSESKVLIHGGRFFPENTEAAVCGSSFGGSLIKSGWIGIGMRMEVLAGGRPIVTSQIRSIHLEPEGNLPGPF